MDQLDAEQLYHIAWRHWGAYAQIDMLIEEMAELTQALLKGRRKGEFTNHNISEETADVKICFEQFESHLKTINVPGGMRNKWVQFNELHCTYRLEETIVWDTNNVNLLYDITIKRMAKLSVELIASRQNNDIYYHDLLESAANVAISLDQLEIFFKKVIVMEGYSIWDDVLQHKQGKLYRLHERLMESMTKKHEGVTGNV